MALTSEAKKHRRIGASQAAACLGRDPWRDPVQLTLELQGKSDPVAETLPMEVGTFLEPLVGRIFARETGLELVRPVWPWSDLQYEQHVACGSGARIMEVAESFGTGPAHYMTSTPDFVVWSDEHQCFAPVECKAVSAYASEAWADESPEHYYIQNVHQCCGLESPIGFVAALIGNAKFAHYVTAPPEEHRRAVIEAEGRIWDHVQAGTLPDPTSLDGAKAKWPQHEQGKTVALERGDFAQAFETMVAAKATAKQAEAAIKAAMLTIAKNMGDAEMLVDGTDIVATYKTDKRGRRSFRLKEI